jgi:hypothetical protein
MRAHKKSESRKIARERYWSEHDRQTYHCPDCGRPSDKIEGTFEVHHKNGSAYDNRMNNLIGLCGLCHALREDKHPSKDRVRTLVESKRPSGGVQPKGDAADAAAVLDEYEDRLMEWFTENEEKQMMQLKDTLDIDGDIPVDRLQPQTEHEIMVYYHGCKQMVDAAVSISEAMKEETGDG